MKTGAPQQLPLLPTRTLEEEEVRTKLLGQRADIVLRVLMVLVVAGIFIWLNYEVMKFIKAVFAADLAMLKTSPAYVPIVKTEVLMSLIGATVIQVGVATITIMAYLFPKEPTGGDS